MTAKRRKAEMRNVTSVLDQHLLVDLHSTTVILKFVFFSPCKWATAPKLRPLTTYNTVLAAAPMIIHCRPCTLYSVACFMHVFYSLLIGYLTMMSLVQRSLAVLNLSSRQFTSLTEILYNALRKANKRRRRKEELTRSRQRTPDGVKETMTVQIVLCKANNNDFYDAYHKQLGQ